MFIATLQQRVFALLKRLHIIPSHAVVPSRQQTINQTADRSQHSFHKASTLNHQVCDQCAPGLFTFYGYEVADTGLCAECSQMGECLDIALIEHYHKHGISNNLIHQHLPRLRWRNTNHSSHQSIDEIESTYRHVFMS